MNWLGQQQREWNVASREIWELSRSHRQRVMELIVAGRRPKKATLCVLGAGNCNDLELSKLVELFCQVHLVDLDGEAVRAAIQRQNVTCDSSITVHGGLDLTGVSDELARFPPGRQPSEIELERIVVAANSYDGPSDLGPFDTVVSTCMLSQLHNAVVHSIGVNDRRSFDVLLAVRHRHLRLLTDLIQPGGRGVLVSDFTSSDTTSRLPSIPEAELPEYLATALNSGNFFHGLNPCVLASQFKYDSIIAPRVTNVQLSNPWRWNFGPRVYAVMAIEFQRR